jgi:hypothetical protein
VARTLADLPHEDRAAWQSQLANQIISLLGSKPTEARFHEDLVENPPEQLRAIKLGGGMPNDRQDTFMVDVVRLTGTPSGRRSRSAAACS